MPLFSAGAIRLESGNSLSSSSMQVVPRATNVRLDYNIPRSNVMVLNRGKPLQNRPVIGYTPVEANVDFYKADNTIEQILGLVHSSNIITNIVETKAGLATTGVRSMQVLFAPTSSSSYNGLLDFKSGVLTSYTLQGGVGEPVRGSFGLQFLDMSGSVNTTARDTTNISASLVKPENVSLTGIHWTGYGLTGMTLQSFSFSLGASRTQVGELGSKYPKERPLGDVGANLTVNGFFDGINNSMTGLNMHDCGIPSVGTVGITMTPACAGLPTSTITITNPYLDNFSIEAAAGGMSTVSISLSAPIGPNPNETTDGSVVTIT